MSIITCKKTGVQIKERAISVKGIYMFCNMADLNLYYKVYNNGEAVENGALQKGKPILIMLHGGPGLNDHTVYVPFWSLISDITQVIFIDMRGHGKSIKNGENPEKWNLKQWGLDLKNFCDTLGIIKPIIAGFSFGGWVAFSYLTQFPNHPGKVILCNTEAFIDIEKRVAAYNKKDISGEAGKIVRYLKEIRGDQRTAQIYVEKLSPFFGANKHYPNDKPSNCIINKAVWDKFDRDEYYDFDYRKQLEKLNFPSELEVLAIAGDEDPEHPWECANEAVQCIGKNNAFLYLVKGAGDPIERDCQEEALTVIKTFITSGIAGIRSGIANAIVNS